MQGQRAARLPDLHTAAVHPGQAAPSVGGRDHTAPACSSSTSKSSLSSRLQLASGGCQPTPSPPLLPHRVLEGAAGGRRSSRAGGWPPSPQHSAAEAPLSSLPSLTLFFTIFRLEQAPPLKEVELRLPSRLLLLLAHTHPAPASFKAMSARRAQQRPPSALWTAANKGDDAAVRKLLRRRGVNLEAGQGTELGTALCAAAQSGHSSIVELLLRAGANVNAHRSEGVTPLHLAAAASGRAAMARRLIAAGADVNARTDEGATPLLWAAEFGELEMVQTLIDAGADIHSTTHDNNITVLHLAARSKEPGLIPYLVAAGAGCYLNSESSYSGSRYSGSQFTPLMVACVVGNAAAVEHFLAAGAEVGARTGEGDTALHLASLNGNREIIELLIAAGADAGAVSNDGCTPKYCAILRGHGKVAIRLHEAATARKRGSQTGGEPAS